MGELEILWKIYEHENNLKKLLKDKSYLESNENLEDTIVKIKEKEYDITSYKTQLEVDNIKIKRLNHKLKEITFELKEVNTKLYSGNISNVKKLTKLQKEEKDMKKDKEKLENEILELMESIETNTKNLYNSEKEHKVLSNKYNDLKEENKVKVNEINENMDNLFKELKLLKSSLDDEKLSEYERIKSKKNKPISKLEDNKCTGCHMSIPSSIIPEVKKGEKIVNCDNCGRILYHGKN